MIQFDVSYTDDSVLCYNETPMSLCMIFCLECRGKIVGKVIIMVPNFESCKWLLVAFQLLCYRLNLLYKKNTTYQIRLKIIRVDTGNDKLYTHAGHLHLLPQLHPAGLDDRTQPRSKDTDGDLKRTLYHT